MLGSGYYIVIQYFCALQNDHHDPLGPSYCCKWQDSFLFNGWVIFLPFTLHILENPVGFSPNYIQNWPHLHHCPSSLLDPSRAKWAPFHSIDPLRSSSQRSQSDPVRMWVILHQRSPITSLILLSFSNYCCDGGELTGYILGPCGGWFRLFMKLADGDFWRMDLLSGGSKHFSH